MATLGCSSSPRVDMLGHYIALHSQQNRLRQSIRNPMPSPPLSPTQQPSPDMSSAETSSSGSPSPTLDAQHFSQLSPPTYALPRPAPTTTIPRRTGSRSPSSIAPIPEEVSLEEFELRGSDEESRLANVNLEIKTTLTELLNSECARTDGKMRLWIQTRLMDAEMELRRQRRSSTRRRSSAPRIVLTPTDDDDTARRQSA